MSIPIIAAGVGLGVLLFAGSKEKAPEMPAGPSATPTQQSTGGEAGGAQAPSHSDVDAQGGEVNTNVGGRGEPNQGYLTAPTAPTAPSSYDSSGSGTGFVAGVTAGLTDTSSSDPWAGGAQPLPQASTPLGGLGVATGMTTRAIGTTFATLGETFGEIW